MKGFSIIVCCYNSAQILPKTLSYLAALSLPEDLDTELIIVDNCCTDQTVDIAQKAWSDYQAPFEMKIIHEETLGLSFARKKGIQTARYEYILFCDDDNWLAGDYLQVAKKLFSDHKNIGMLGGLGVAVYDRIPDYWPKDFYIYGSGPQAKENGKTWTLHGAAILLNKAAFNRLEAVGFGFILTDRKGDSLSSGGDYELCYAMALAGYEIWYHADLRFSHYILSGRMTWGYCKRFIHESAPAVNVLDVYRFILTHEGKRKAAFYLKLVKFLLHHTKKIFQSSYIKYKYSHDEKICFLQRFHRAYHVARIISICQTLFRYKRYFREVNHLKSQLASLASAAGTGDEAAFVKLK